MQKLSNEFYKSIIEPVKDFIPSDGKLIFSLPVELSIVPLEFLVTDFKLNDSPFYYENKKFLIEEYSVTYTPSVSVYLLQKEKPVIENEKLLLVGDPQITSGDFAQSYRGSLIEDQSFSSRNLRLFPLKYSKEEVDKSNQCLLMLLFFFLKMQQRNSLLIIHQIKLLFIYQRILLFTTINHL